jgi:hypothetical protein
VRVHDDVVEEVGRRQRQRPHPLDGDGLRGAPQLLRVGGEVPVEIDVAPARVDERDGVVEGELALAGGRREPRLAEDAHRRAQPRRLDQHVDVVSSAAPPHWTRGHPDSSTS